eukprot:gene14535-14658_t
MDRDDPLGFVRDRFDVPEDVIYLDGNSLGALPRATPEALEQATRKAWGKGLIRSWNTEGWIDQPLVLGGRIGRLIGAETDEVAVTDSTSVNLFKLASAAMAMRPDRRVILSEAGNFPTDLYMLQGLVEQLGGRAELRVVERAAIADAITDEVALMVLTHVHYVTGEIFDMPGLTRRAHAVGALTLWDLSHSCGALEVDLNGAGADFAIGCGYKYLNGGPGAPAYAFAAKRHHKAMRQPLSGWMGHAKPFDFVDDYAPAPGIAQVLCGTPSVLAMTALKCGLDTFEGVEMAAVRQKSIAVSEVFRELMTAPELAEFQLVSPEDPKLRGSHLSYAHQDGYAIMAALIDRGVIGDFRAPDRLRFGFTPLYARFVDMFDAVERLKAVMRDGAWRAPKYAVRQAVT